MISSTVGGVGGVLLALVAWRTTGVVTRERRW
jgi:hypothetical protein